MLKEKELIFNLVEELEIIKVKYSLEKEKDFMYMLSRLKKIEKKLNGNIQGMNISTKEEFSYESITEASRITGISIPRIKKAIEKGVRTGQLIFWTDERPFPDIKYEVSIYNVKTRVMYRYINKKQAAESIGMTRPMIKVVLDSGKYLRGDYIIFPYDLKLTEPELRKIAEEPIVIPRKESIYKHPKLLTTNAVLSKITEYIKEAEERRLQDLLNGIKEKD